MSEHTPGSYRLLTREGTVHDVTITVTHQGDWPVLVLGGLPVSSGGLTNYLQMRGLTMEKETE